MSNSSSEKDKETYSVDEMMARLRDSGGDSQTERDSELVTREDGSQAVKVRKRKRRSKQPAIEKAKRAKQFATVKMISLIAVPLIGVIFLLLLLARYFSPSYQEKVSNSIAAATGANVKMTRMSPMIATLKGTSIAMAWPDGSPLDQVKVTGIAGNLDIFPALAGSLSGADLGSDSGYLIVSNRKDRKVNPPQKEGGAIPKFERLSSESFSFYFGGLKSPLRVDDTSVTYFRKNDVNYFSINGGQLIAPGWGAMAIQQGSFEAADGRVGISSFRLGDGPQSLFVTGSLDWSKPEQRLAVEMQKGTLSSFGGPSLGKLLKGPLDGSKGELRFKSWELRSHEMVFSVLPSYLTLKNFRFLDSLERLYGESIYSEFEFQPTIPFEIARGSDKVEIRNFEAISIGTLGLRGDLQVKDNQLSGKVWLGLPDHRQILIGQSKRKAFLDQATHEDGFFWFEVKLSGSADAPQDNFWDYLQEEEGPSAQELFDQLTN